MSNLKTVYVMLLSLGFTSAFAHPGHRHPPHHGHPPRHGHPPHRDNDDDNAGFFTLGALLGSLVVSSTHEANDDYKEVIDRSDAIVEQILNKDMPAAFYTGFRTQEKYKSLDSYEIDLILLDTLSSL